MTPWASSRGGRGVQGRDRTTTPEGEARVRGPLGLLQGPPREVGGHGEVLSPDDIEQIEARRQLGELRSNIGEDLLDPLLASELGPAGRAHQLLEALVLLELLHHLKVRELRERAPEFGPRDVEVHVARNQPGHVGVESPLEG